MGDAGGDAAKSMVTKLLGDIAQPTLNATS
jgi:hypothetical protein